MTDKLSDAWRCQSCGCYFPHIPTILDDDIKRCSKCVEVEVLEQRLERADKLQEASIEFYCGVIDKAEWRIAVRNSPKGQELMALAAAKDAST